MKIIDFETHKLLTTEDSRKVFDVIARLKSASLEELSSIEHDREKLMDTIEHLHTVGLVKKLGVGVSDLDRYYLTEDGIKATKIAG